MGYNAGQGYNRYNGERDDDRPPPAAWGQPTRGRPVSITNQSGRRPLPPPAVPNEFRDNGRREYRPPQPQQGFPRYDAPWQQRDQYAHSGPAFGQAERRQQAPPPPQQRQPAPYSPQQPASGPRQPHTTRNVLVGIGGLAILIILIAAANSHGGSPTAGSSPAAGTSTAADGSTPASTTPAGTVSELQALTAAEDYLSDGQGFSRQGLIDQLDSQYGDGFSVPDATWAVDNSGADWDEQAVDAARAYASDGQGFSREGLIQQLTSSYGNQFTEAQATYAVNTVGL